MCHPQREPAAFSDLDLVPSTGMVAHNALESKFKGSQHPLLASTARPTFQCSDIHAGRTFVT